MKSVQTGARFAFEGLEERLHLSGAADLTRTSASLSQARWPLAATAAAGKAFFAGGTTNAFADSDVIDVYDAATGHWSVAHLPRPSVSNVAVAAGGKALIVGGDSAAHRFVEIFDATTGRWSTSKLPRPRTGGAGAAAGNLLIFVGTARAASAYDVRTGHWSTIRLSRRLDAAGATSVGGQAIFATGSIAAVYDSVTKRWSTQTLPQAVFRPAATTVGTKAIFPATLSGVVDIYDAVTGQWSTAPLSQNREGAAATTIGSKAIFAGGYSPESDVVDVYDDRTGEWSVASPLSHARDGIGVASVGMQAIFGGGEDGYPNADATVDIYTDASPSASLDGVLAGRPRRRASVTISNTGDAPLPAGSTVTVYASPDRTLIGAVPLSQITLADALAAGSSIQGKVKTPIPATLAPGTYHLLAAVDDHSGSVPTPIAAQAQTFTVRSHSAHTAASRFRGLFARFAARPPAPAS